MNPSVDALRTTFGDAIGRAEAARDGETIAFVRPDRLTDVMRWLRDTPGQAYDYLVDVTAVEYRDRERALEVVYFLRSLERHADLRVKVELDPRGELAVDSVTPLWAEVDEQMLAAEVGLVPAFAAAGDERHARRLPPGVQARGRQLELDGALAHSSKGSLPRSPRRSRSRISAGTSSKASAMDSSSRE